MISPYYFVGFNEYIYILDFSYILFYKLINQPQLCLNFITAKLWLYAYFPIDFAFLYFLNLLSFLVFSIFVQPWHVLSYSLSHIYICRPKQAESCVGRTKEEWIRGPWMKGGGPCYSSWIFCSRITFPCPSVNPPPTGLPWPWKIL